MKFNLDESMKNVALESLTDFEAILTAPPLLQHGIIVALYNDEQSCFVRIHDGQVETNAGGDEEDDDVDDFTMYIDELPINWESERFLVIQPTKNKSLVALYGVSSKRYLRVIPDDLEKVGVSVPKVMGDPIDDEEIFDVICIKHTFKNNTYALRSPVTNTFLSIAADDVGLDMTGKAVSDHQQFAVAVLHEPKTIVSTSMLK